MDATLNIFTFKKKTKPTTRIAVSSLPSPFCLDHDPSLTPFWMNRRHLPSTTFPLMFPLEPSSFLTSSTYLYHFKFFLTQGFFLEEWFWYVSSFDIFQTSSRSFPRAPLLPFVLSLTHHIALQDVHPTTAPPFRYSMTFSRSTTSGVKFYYKILYCDLLDFTQSSHFGPAFLLLRTLDFLLYPHIFYASTTPMLDSISCVAFSAFIPPVYSNIIIPVTHPHLFPFHLLPLCYVLKWYVAHTMLFKQYNLHVVPLFTAGCCSHRLPPYLRCCTWLTPCGLL
jgi:hypothetical protein